MKFDSLEAFLAMGGYGFFVWLSFGTAFVLLAALLMLSKRNQTLVIKKIAQRLKREEKLKQAAQMNKSSESSSPT